jgi:hypothetical protein
VIESLSFVVGENGRKSGLAVSSYGGFELRLLVLPKVWSRIDDDQAIGHSPEVVKVGHLLTIVAPEGCVFRVVFQQPDAPGAKALKKCFEDIAHVAQDRSKRELADDDAEDDPFEHTRRVPLIKERLDSDRRTDKCITVTLDLAAYSPPHKDSLIDLMPEKAWGEPKLQQRETRRFAEYWKGFQALWLVSLDLQDMQSLRIEGLGQMSATDIESIDLQLLLHIAFVAQVRDLLWHARPGYVRVTKPSQFIRGRMNPVSAARALFGGGNTVECTYDEFGLDTPLLQVIVAALEEVADAHQSGWSLLNAEVPAQEAAWLRGRFETVQSLPRATASRIGIGLQAKMSKLDGDWRLTLDLACLVLANGSLSPAPGSRLTSLSWGERRGTRAYVFDISTESCWERLVRKYMAAKKPQGIQSWTGLGKRKAPDGKLGSIIFDAKYKKSENMTPATNDQHQAFVHSHLFGSEQVLLIYPTPDRDATKPVSIKPYLRFNPASKSPDCKLAAIRLPFPTMDDLTSHRKWELFLGCRREELGSLLRHIAPTDAGGEMGERSV